MLHPFAQLLKPGKCHGPENTGKEDQYHIPHSPGDHVTAEKCVQRHSQALLDRQCQSEAKHGLQELGIPDGFRGETNPAEVLLATSRSKES